MRLLPRCLIVLLLIALPGIAAAQSESLLWQIRPRLDPLPPELSGLLVRLYQTVSPQIAVHNLTGDPLVILDSAGQPFLKIGPYEVQANFANAAFYRSRHPEPRELPDAIGGADRWRRVSSGPAWAWFDARLRVDLLQIPPRPRMGDPAFVQRWAIPVRLGATEAIISGYFLYFEAPQGLYRTQITGNAGLGPQVDIYPAAGRVPGLFVTNQGNATFTVLGLSGEPFLRFVPGKVLVNRSSDTWRIAAPADALAPYAASADGQPDWVVVSTTGSFAWAEPRAFYEGPPPEGAAPVEVKEWEVPILTAEGQDAITGITQWLPPAPDPAS